MRNLLILVFVFCCCRAEAQQPYALKTEGLKGKVKSVTMKWTYRYMPDGKKFTEWAPSGGYTSTFSSKGQYISRVQLDTKASLQSTAKYAYKPDGREHEIKYYRPDGSMSGYTLYKTNEKGAPLTETRFDTTGKIWTKYIFSYDAAGHLIQMDGFKADGAISSQIFYRLNEKGNRIEMKTVTPKYATSYQYYEYDAKGNISVEKWPSVAGLKSFRFERSYDDKGNKIREVKFVDDVQKSIATWVYEYDKQGNWTKQTEYSNEGEPFSIYERTITYH